MKTKSLNVSNNGGKPASSIKTTQPGFRKFPTKKKVIVENSHHIRYASMETEGMNVHNSLNLITPNTNKRNVKQK